MSNNSLLKKRLRFASWLACWIILLTVLAIGMAYISKGLQNIGFFGDILRTSPTEGGIDKMHDWGLNHYYFFVMGVLLSIVYVIRVGMWIDWFWDERQNTKQY